MLIGVPVALRGAAHSPQNFAVGAFSNPHFAHCLLKGAAHSLQNFKLLDEESGEIVATFANNGLKSWKKKGKFRIVEGLYGTEWEKAALLTGLCLIERARRRQRASRAGGGGGAP